MIASLFVLSGCGSNASTSGSDDQASGTESTSATETTLDLSTMFSDRDYETEYTQEDCVEITLDGSTGSCSSDAVSISNSEVRITEEGTYVLQGSFNGMVVIDAEKTDKVQLVLDGVSIASKTTAAIYVLQADKVFLTLAEGTENTLENGGEFVAIDDNNIDAVIYSKDDLTLNGTGSLTIQSPAGHGIVSKDDLAVTGGNYTITAENQGLSGKESVRIADGSFVITAGKDGIHAEDADDSSLGFLYIANGTFDITADGDGISASNTLRVDDGTFTLLTGGGSSSVTKNDSGDWSWDQQGADTTKSEDSTSETASAKGLKATGALAIIGGTFSIDSADDGLHTNAALTITDGTYTIASGDDGIHGDGLTAIAGGTIKITKSYEGIEGLSIAISGGDIEVTASDDGLNAAGGNDQSGAGGYGGFEGNGASEASSDCDIAISGGTLKVNASGDGIDSNGTITVSGGETYVSGPTSNGNGALDYGTDAVISGGIFLAAGSSGMASNFGASSTQGVMMVSISSESENGAISLKDSSGTTLLSWTAAKPFSSVVLSCPEIQEGAAYTVSTDDESTEVTMTSLVYGSSAGGGKTGDRGANGADERKEDGKTQQ